ncbi:MAG: hypothetical protein QM737_22505 [Ferruginibacter sp.]
MKKFLVFIATIIISIILAGLFGIIHDEITYTISNEYFTKFKFHQFGLANTDDKGILPNPRQAVAIVGVLATTWVGAIIGLALGITGMAFMDHKKMFKAMLAALLLTFKITVLTAFIGFFYGKFYLASTKVHWWLPDDLVDRNNFITVGCIHSASYLGGLTGLVFSLGFLIKKNRIQRKEIRNVSQRGDANQIESLQDDVKQASE